MCELTFDYDYDPGEGREKHRWSKQFAGFKPGRKGPVGKCSSLIDEERARELLNDGIALPDNAGGNHPRKIVNQFAGAIYVAVPTEPGKSYHGYPWRDDQGPTLPKSVLKKLEVRARAAGYLDEYNKWLKKYGPIK